MPEKSVLLAFDDGWRSVLNALPALERYQFKASFWIITGAMEGRFGPDYLGPEEIKRLDENPLFEIASHSVTHPWDNRNNLVTQTEGTDVEQGLKAAVLELRESHQVLEELLGRPILYFAWPAAGTIRLLSMQRYRKDIKH